MRAAGLLLVHGAGSGPWVFDGWAASFPRVAVAAVDLHDGLDVARASMVDYARRVAAAAAAVPRPLAICGWSMGGLVALLAAPAAAPAAVVVLEPSPPAEVQGADTTVVPAPGTFDPEREYGPFPPGMRARPESSLARAERKRGLSVPALACRALVVHGDEFPVDRGSAVAACYGAAVLALPGLDHWDLVRHASVRPPIARFLEL